MWMAVESICMTSQLGLLQANGWVQENQARGGLMSEQRVREWVDGCQIGGLMSEQQVREWVDGCQIDLHDELTGAPASKWLGTRELGKRGLDE